MILMTKSKSGPVTMEIGKTVKEVMGGKTDFKVDQAGIIHTSVGKASFSHDQLFDNAVELLQAIAKLKPSSAKG